MGRALKLDFDRSLRASIPRLCDHLRCRKVEMSPGDGGHGQHDAATRIRDHRVNV
jgi:hypothetical protein